jgi:predicted enzyme related to lactoylglutathione lyase
MGCPQACVAQTDDATNLVQVALSATDLEHSVDFYRRMGFKQVIGSPDHARVVCPAGDATSSLHRFAQPVPDTHVAVYFATRDVDAEVKRLQAAGFMFTQLPQDERWLWREVRLQDPSGNVLCLFWAAETRKSPPLWPPDRTC